MTPEQLAELAERIVPVDVEETLRICDAATAGPWYSFSDIVGTKYREGGEATIFVPGGHSLLPLRDHQNNAIFAAHARTALPSLAASVAVVRELFSDQLVHEALKACVADDCDAYLMFKPAQARAMLRVLGEEDFHA